MTRWALKKPRCSMPPRDRSSKLFVRSRRRGRSTTARSAQSMRWCRIISHVFPNPVWRLGPPLAQCYARLGARFRVMLPNAPGSLSSGMCASIRSPRSGAARRRFWLFAARLDAGALQIVRAARSGFWRMPPPGVPPYGRCPRCRSGMSPVAAPCARRTSPRRAKMPPTAIVGPDPPTCRFPIATKRLKVETSPEGARAPRPFSSGPRK